MPEEVPKDAKAPKKKGTKTCGRDGCNHFVGKTDTHTQCISHRACTGDEANPCPQCIDWSQEDWFKFRNRKAYVPKSKTSSQSVSVLGTDNEEEDPEGEIVPTTPVYLGDNSQPDLAAVQASNILPMGALGTPAQMYQFEQLRNMALQGFFAQPWPPAPRHQVAPPTPASFTDAWLAAHSQPPPLQRLPAGLPSAPISVPAAAFDPATTPGKRRGGQPSPPASSQSLAGDKISRSRSRSHTGVEEGRGKRRHSRSRSQDSADSESDRSYRSHREHHSRGKRSRSRGRRSRSRGRRSRSRGRRSRSRGRRSRSRSRGRRSRSRESSGAPSRGRSSRSHRSRSRRSRRSRSRRSRSSRRDSSRRRRERKRIRERERSLQRSRDHSRSRHRTRSKEKSKDKSKSNEKTSQKSKDKRDGDRAKSGSRSPRQDKAKDDITEASDKTPSKRHKSRSRSRSPEEEEGTMKFKDRIDLVRKLFQDLAEILLCPPTPGETSENLGMSATPKPNKSVSLPLNPTTARLLTEAMKKLTGLDPKGKASAANGLQPGTYLKKPEFREKSYRVTGQENVSQAATVPLDFRTLQETSKAAINPPLSLSQADTMEMEVQLRRLGTILSHQDWFLGSVRRLSETVAETLNPVPEAFSQLQDMLQSGTRAGLDGQKMVSQLLHNWVLRRRDLYLKDTFKTINLAAKTQLRQHALDDKHLFSKETCQEVCLSYTQAANSRQASRSDNRPSGQQQARRPQARSSVMERSYPPQQQQGPAGWPQQQAARGGGRGGGRGHRGKRGKKPHYNGNSANQGEGGRKH